MSKGREEPPQLTARPHSRRAEISRDKVVALRDQGKIVPGQISVVFDAPITDTETVVFFECGPCETLVAWVAAKGVWECPECGLELTGAEARLLIDKRQKQLLVLQRYVDKKVPPPPEVLTPKKGFWSWVWEMFSFKQTRLDHSNNSSKSESSVSE